MIRVRGDQSQGHLSSRLLFHDCLWPRCIPSFFTAGASRPTCVRTVGVRRIWLCSFLIPGVGGGPTPSFLELESPED